MAEMFVGLDEVSRAVTDFFIGVDGVAHRVKAAYIGVDGAARLFYGGWYIPSVNEVVLNLSGDGLSSNDGIVYSPGRYEVQIAGTPTTESSFAKNNAFTLQTVISSPFKIVGITSDTATDDFLTNLGIVSEEGTIFGGAGGSSALGGSAGAYPASVWSQGALAHGGACCHFIGARSTFGSSYLRCFHCGAPASGNWGGSGAYGGGAGGRGAHAFVAVGMQGSGRHYYRTGATGKAGAGGAGGAGGYSTIGGGVGSGMNGTPGSSGSGIGAGTASTAGVAWYDGTTWAEPTRSTNSTGAAYIKVIYRGTN